MSFTIDSSSPTALLVFQPSGIPVPPAVSATIVGDRVSVALSTPVLDVSSFSFSFSDAGSGLADARVFEDGLLVFSAAPSPPSTVPVTGSMSLREGSLYELDLLDALGRATRASFYVDVTSPSVTLGSVKFSSSPALDRPALYAIDGTASDGFWLKEARVFRFQDINFADMTPALYESLPAVAISSGEPSVPEAQRSSAFSFTGLSADQYVVIAMDAAGHLSQKELNVQFQETAINGDGAPYDCRVALQGGTDLLSLRRVADGSFASSGSASGIVSNPLFGVETLGTLIKALRVELGTTTAAFTGLPLGSPQDGTVTLAVRTAAPHDPSYLDLFAPPSGTFTAPTPGLLLPGGALRLRVELEHNTAGTFPGFTSPLVGDVRLDAVHYLAHVVSAGDGPMTSSRASFGPGSPSAVLDPEGRAIAVEFPDGVNADGTASAALVLLNPDPTCGYASATPPASVVATAVSADPVFNGRARVTLPLDPALAQADMPFVQARLRSGNGPENITDSVDPAAGRITALSDALGVIELLLPTGSDRVPPATAFLPGTPLDPAGDPVVAGGTAPPLSASDQASGVLMTQYRLGTGPYFAAARALNLPSGKVDIHFRSWDEENNLEPTHHRRILVDAEPPVITALFPSSATFGDAVSSFTVAWTLLDDLDPAPTAQARLMQLEDTGTPNSGSTVVVVALGRLFFAPELDDGSWVLEVTARDWVLNSTAAYSVPFQIVHPLDSTPPHTQLTLGPPSVLGDPSFVSSQTVISLAATDDLSGVASLTYAIDGSTSIVLASSASFSLAQEGPKNLAYSAVDVAGNIEPVQTSSITVDNTPPAPLAVFPASGTYIGQAPHFLSASFSDPEAAPGFPGSGLDPGAFKVFDGAVELAGAVPAGDSLTLNASLGEGSHLASFHAADRVANAAVAVTSFTVDLTPPSIALLSTGPYYTQPRPTFAAAFNDQLSGLATGQLSLSLGGPALTLSPVLQGGDGKVTAWQTAPSLSFPVVSHAMASLGGFLYSLGGHKNVNLGGDEVRTEVFASPLGPGGAPGAWTATTALPARLAGHSAVAVNGRLYVLGGARTGTAAVNTVYFASPVGPNGALGTWSTAAALPQAISGLDAVGVGVGSIGPYLYALGGQDAAGQTHREVYVAPLDPVGGAPGSWTATTLLPEPLGSPRVVEWNRRLYVMGGITQPALSSITNKVWSAPVQAGGLLGAWRAEPDLPAGRYGAEAVSAMGRVYSLGGWDAAAVPHAEVNSAEVGTDGVLGAWRPEAPLHLPLVALAAAATAEGIYYGGGMTAGNAAVADARFTRVDAGTPGSARLEGVPEEDLADGQYTLTAAGTDRVGNATSASALVTVDGAPPAIALSAAGAALSSAALAFVPGALPELVASFSDAVSGIDPSGVTLSLDGLDVTTQAAVSAAQARFTPAPPFAPGRHSLEAAARDLAGNQARLTADFILDPEPPAVALSSPAPGAFFSSSTVQFAAGFSDGLSGLATGQLRLSWEGGSLQPALSFTEGSGGTGWQTAPALAFPVVSHAMAALGGTLYSLGGHKNVNLGGDEVRTEVFASPLGPGGAPGAWTATTALPARLAGHSAVAVNGRVYVLGGARTGTAAVNTVYYSSLVGTAGTVTGWTTAAALPQAISGLDAVGVGVGSIGPYLYALGGQDAGGLPHREVYVAPLDPASGAPGGWTATTLLPEPLGSPEVVEWNQRLYVMGGITQPALSSITNKVWSAPVQAGGLLGAWRAEPDLPAGRYGAEAVSVQGRVYYLGGWDAAAVPHAEVNSAEVGTDGVLGTWRAEAPLHLPLVALAAAATAEGIYYGGGMTTGNAAVADARWRGLRTGVASAAALALAQGLPEGPHEARAEAADRAGNTALSSAAFFVDLTPPDTRLVVAAASRTFNGDLYVLGVPTVSFSVTDGPEGAASGLGQTLFSVDAGSEAPAGDFVAPPAGWSTLRFRSVDAVGNAEIAKSSAVKLDAVPPAAVTDLAGTALSTSAIRLTWTVPGDDGASGDIADGSAGVAFSRLEAQTTGGAGTVAAAGSLRAGAGLSWTAAGLSPDTLYYAAAYTQDTAGNWSPASAPVAVRTLAEDVLPPRTRLVATGPQVPGTTLFITPQTSLTLSATDDLLVQGDGAGVGVAGSAYSLDSASLFTDYQSSFSITAQTAHDLRYFSTDRVAHVEEIKLTSVAVDGTGPAVALGYQVPFRTWLGTTTVFVQGLGPLFISATDYPALAVGTSVVYLSVDGADAQASPAPFSLPEGLRSLALWAVDRLGTQGSTVTASLKLDATAPSAALDLTMAALSSSAVTVSWTAPGDDGASGDIYDAAVRLDFGTDPGSLAQSLVLSSGALAVGMRLTQAFSGLAPGTTYFAAVLTRDSAGNWSDPAGAAARTFSVAVSADNVATLASPVPAEVTVVSTVTESQAYTVAIASQGLTPAGSVFYELTGGLVFSTAAPALISFTFDPVLVDSASVAIYTYDIQTMNWSTASIFNQTLALLESGLYQVSGEILHTSLYAPMVRDTAPPLTAFSVLGSSAVLEGRLFAVGGSSGVLSAQDLAPLGGTPSGVAATLYRGGVGPETVYNAPFALPEGDIHLEFHSLDRSGNAEPLKEARVFVDGTPPTLTFSADQSTFSVPGGFGTLSATVTVTLSATDPEAAGAASGLASFTAVLDGNPVVVPAGLLLGPGLHTLALSAADRLGNAAGLVLRVAVGDTLPPQTTLLVGTPQAGLPDGSTLVSAASALSLSAEDSAESGAPSGVADMRYRFGLGEYTVYSGTFAVPGPDGAKALQYFSTDRAGNAEAPKAAALVLDATPPAAAFAFPRPDEPGLCRLAQGRVQVRGTVSDAHMASWSLKDGPALLGSGTQDTDGLLGVWDATGKTGSFELTLTASDLVENAAAASLLLQAGAPSKTLALGGKKALNKPRGVAWAPNRVYVADTGHDLVRVYDASGNLLASFGDQRRSLKLNKPSGLAVDASGSIFVADRNNKRVVKLSPSGTVVLEFGGKKSLEKPVAVALVPGKVLVADAHSGEVVVFSDSGALLRRLALPTVAAGEHDDDEEEDEARPMALAAESSGAFWVADSKGRRVLRYDADFNPVQTIPGFERPEGLAVSPSGACLAVVDAKAGRVRTFDAALGSELAVFGQADLHKPAQAVFTADGQLLVANRNEDQITGFGLPGTPVLIAMTQPKGGFRASDASEPASAEPVVARVGRVEGGFVEEPGGAAVEVPAGALAQDLDISVAVAPEAGVAERASQNLTAASAPREFGPHGQLFALPVTIILPYDPGLASGLRPEELKIHYWNAERGAWEALASRVDADAHTVSAQTSHFSLYQVLAPVRSLSLLADPEATFSLRSVYAFPNPAVGGQKPTIHVAVGKADRVTIRIYDIAGTPVHETTLDGSPSVVNDDMGAHFAYEYSWAGHIPSGVYLYVVTAEKAGQAPIKRVGKMAVVR